MKTNFYLLLFLGLVLFSTVPAKDCRAAGNNGPDGVKVHAVTDLAHEFTFYADNRFHMQYLPQHKGVTCWTSLYNFDFSNANLLILLGCENLLNYSAKDVACIENFLNAGGGVVLLGGEWSASQNALARLFGAEFVGNGVLPFQPNSAETAVKAVEASGHTFLNLENPIDWKIIVSDAKGQPVLARRPYGKGHLLVGSRFLAGFHPDASDSVNYQMWRPLLESISSGKAIDPSKPFNSREIKDLEYREKHETFLLSYNDYMRPYAEAMGQISKRCFPAIEKRMGVPLSQGMGGEITLLATGGGGFSSGDVIALATWWGDFPKKEEHMIEFLTHESVHSWVLPYPEVWNEPIATYVGHLVAMDLGYPDAQKRIDEQIASAKNIDPNLNVYDLDGRPAKGGKALDAGQTREVHWGKTYWFFEQLRKDYPDVVARYFKTKRKLLGAQKIKEYDINNTVAVLSKAVGKDLFPWFKEHGIAVNKNKAEIK